MIDENLTLDFPKLEEHMIHRSEKKRPSFQRSDAVKNLPTMDDRVHFAEECELRVYEPCDESEKSTLWYSNRDFKTMRKATKKAVKDMQKKILERKSGDFDFFENPALIGIECLLSPNITRQNRRKVRECLMAEQERQQYALVCDPDRLASVIRVQTRLAAGRARTIGLVQAK